MPNDLETSLSLTEDQISDSVFICYGVSFKESNVDLGISLQPMSHILNIFVCLYFGVFYLQGLSSTMPLKI